MSRTAYSPNLGGCDIDYTLLQHFAEVNAKYKVDILLSPKATFRLLLDARSLRRSCLQKKTGL